MKVEFDYNGSIIITAENATETMALRAFECGENYKASITISQGSKEIPGFIVFSAEEV